MNRPDLDAIERAVNETPGEPDDSMIMNLIAYARHLEARISELETALEPFSYGPDSHPGRNHAAWGDARRALRKGRP